MLQRNSNNKRTRERVKVKIKKRDTKFLNSIQVPTSNRFNTLDNSAMDTDQTQKEKKVNISPIVITDFETDLGAFLKDTNVECNIKLISVGRKIFPSSAEDKTKIIEALKTKNLNYFSHPDNDGKIFKVVLSGLPSFDTVEIERDYQKCIQYEAMKIYSELIYGLIF